MVRLKVQRHVEHMYTLFISIPYGAIKSLSTFNSAHTKFFISIPYGAIKRLEKLD